MRRKINNLISHPLISGSTIIFIGVISAGKDVVKAVEVVTVVSIAFIIAYYGDYLRNYVVNKKNHKALKSLITINKPMISRFDKLSTYKGLCLESDEKTFDPDSTSKGIEYYVADVQFKNELNKIKNYRLIWLFEGERLEIIGVINAFRVKKTK